MKDSMKAYLSHKFDTSDDAVLSELIQEFNLAIANNTVKQLNVKSTFTIKGERYWLTDDGMVLSTNT
jgi:hypothetical protein